VRRLLISKLRWQQNNSCHSIQRTAVYGPVCTVVWEGGAARFPPIPIALRERVQPRNAALQPLAGGSSKKRARYLTSLLVTSRFPRRIKANPATGAAGA
jgi:hypothetical protein